MKVYVINADGGVDSIWSTLELAQKRIIKIRKYYEFVDYSSYDLDPDDFKETEIV